MGARSALKLREPAGVQQVCSLQSRSTVFGSIAALPYPCPAGKCLSFERLCEGVHLGARILKVRVLVSGFLNRLERLA